MEDITRAGAIQCKPCIAMMKAAFAEFQAELARQQAEASRQGQGRRPHPERLATFPGHQESARG
jgi:hypothetical protein